MKEQCYFTVLANSELGRKLDKLQQDYANGNQYALDDALSLLRDKIEKVARVYSRRMIPDTEFISALRVAVWKAFATYKPEKGASFTTHLTKVASRGVADVFRQHGKYAEKCVLASAATPSEDDDFSAVSGEITYFDGLATSRTSINFFTDEHFDMISDVRDVEADVLDRMMVEKQRELITYIYENVPEKDRENARVFMKLMYEGYPGISHEELQTLSKNKIAEICGIYHSRVDRVFNRLSRLFDPKKFGELEDYRFRMAELYPRRGEHAAKCKLPPAKKSKSKSTKRSRRTRG